MRRVLSELEALEREARLQPSPAPRVNEPWELILARQQELRRNWLPPAGFQRRHENGRFKAAADLES